MAESEDIEILKRRGRRRLLGAVALVVLAVIVLPMVFDQEPKGTSAPVSVRIPSEDAAPFAPKVATTPSVPQAASQPAKAGTATPPSSPAAQGAGQQTAKSDQASKPSTVPQEPAAAVAPPAAARPATAAPKPAAKQEFIIPVVALANRDKLKAVTDKLAKAKLPYYTEQVATAKGTVTRVRVGPYDRREAAERALKRLKQLDFAPGAITTRSG
jgi:DedD protein